MLGYIRQSDWEIVREYLWEVTESLTKCKYNRATLLGVANKDGSLVWIHGYNRHGEDRTWLVRTEDGRPVRLLTHSVNAAAASEMDPLRGDLYYVRCRWRGGKGEARPFREEYIVYRATVEHGSRVFHRIPWYSKRLDIMLSDAYEAVLVRIGSLWHAIPIDPPLRIAHLEAPEGSDPTGTNKDDTQVLEKIFSDIDRAPANNEYHSEEDLPRFKGMHNFADPSNPAMFAFLHRTLYSICDFDTLNKCKDWKSGIIAQRPFAQLPFSTTSKFLRMTIDLKWIALGVLSPCGKKVAVYIFNAKSGTCVWSNPPHIHPDPEEALMWAADCRTGVMKLQGSDLLVLKIDNLLSEIANLC